MGTHFRVAELAKLYGLNSDTLRYYEEQGLLHPHRGENRYREYTIADLCDLNIIRALRALDMPVAEIRGYLGERTVERTGAMLERQREIIGEKIAALREEERAARRRGERLRAAMTLPVGVPALLELPERQCLVMRERGIPATDVDLLLKRLERRHSGVLRTMGSRAMGAVIDPGAVADRRFDRYSAVFFLWEGDGAETECIPAGTYLSAVHAGGYDSLDVTYRLLADAAAARGLEAIDTPIELYHVDVHDTGDEREYRTEVQVRVRAAV